MRKTARAAMPFLAAGLIYGGAAMAIEEPAYEIVARYPEIELRRYAPSLVAATEVRATFDQAGKIGFRILADYIFGNNLPRSKIEMTAPVGQQPAGDSIEMTAPVSQQPVAPGTERYLVTFVMPTRFTLETLPEPRDDRVQIEQVPARFMAVRRYSGFWSEENYRANEEILLRAVREASLTPIAEPVYARYDPPFMPWLMRRNEVQVEVAEPPAGAGR